MQHKLKVRSILAATALGLTALLTFTGCSTISGGVAPSSTPIEGRKYSTLGMTASTDSRIAILGIIPISSSNSTRDALEAAIRKVHADALIDVTVETYFQWWILFTRTVTKVEGLGIKFDR